MEKLTNEFKIEFTKGDTYALAIKFKNITEDLRLAYFSVKENPDDSPLIQKSLGAGISKVDDRAYKNEKTYKVQLQPVDTIDLEAKVQYLYDIQVTVGGVVKTVLHGVFVLGNTITGTSSVTTQELEVAIDDELETEVSIVPATNGVEYEQDPIACAKIGDLEILNTDDKESIVKSINEVFKKLTANINQVWEVLNGTIRIPKAEHSDYSTNVTSQINGNAIENIFEADGTTVKKATMSENATSSDNATKVQGVDFSDDNASSFGEYVVQKKKLIWSGSKTIYGVQGSDLIQLVNREGEEILSSVKYGKTYIFKGEYCKGVTDKYNEEYYPFEISFTMGESGYIPCSPIYFIKAIGYSDATGGDPTAYNCLMYVSMVDIINNPRGVNIQLLRMEYGDMDRNIRFDGSFHMIFKELYEIIE